MMEFDVYGDRYVRGGDKGTTCFTFEDWKASRRATGRCYGYRWVDPHRDNRTKEEWPYSYSDHYLVGTATKGDCAVYSDRLHQWDHVSFDRARARTGDYTKSLRKASDFMTTYYNRPIKVTAVAEGCNVSSGYPYWVIWFHDAK